jgi:hypothetical protein
VGFASTNKGLPRVYVGGSVYGMGGVISIWYSFFFRLAYIFIHQNSGQKCGKKYKNFFKKRITNYQIPFRVFIEYDYFINELVDNTPINRRKKKIKEKPRV